MTDFLSTKRLIKSQFDFGINGCYNTNITIRKIYIIIEFKLNA